MPAMVRQCCLAGRGRWNRWLIACGFLLFSGGPWLRASVDDGGPLAADPQESAAAMSVEQWIADLQAKQYAKREAATRALSQVEFRQLKEVLPLLTSEDAEVAWRAREVFVQQGVRGGTWEVRRIGLMFKLLTQAGRSEFRLDAENFASWVETVRVSELLKRMQQIQGLQMGEGLRFVGRNAGANVLRLEGGAILLPAGELPRQIFLEDLLLERQAAKPREVRPLGQESAVEADGQATLPVEGATASDTDPLADAAIRQAYILCQLPNWLEQCLASEEADFAALEMSLRSTGIIQPEMVTADGMLTHYEVWVMQPLNPADFEVFTQFLENRVSLSLILTEIPLDQRWRDLLTMAAEAGKLQMLNTVKCVYDLDVYRELNRLSKAGKLGYWTTQGRAMLGIRGSNLAIDRMGREVGGAEVGEVTPGSAAEVAGIQSGDIITHVNETPVDNFEELRKIVSAFDVGQSIRVLVARRGAPQPLELEVRLMQHAQ